MIPTAVNSLGTSSYPLPETVQRSIDARRDAATSRSNRQCAFGDGPAVVARGGGAALCARHDTGGQVPTPDPRMAEAHLRATRGHAYTPARTSFDTRVEQNGQRIGAARRAHLRGDHDDPGRPDSDHPLGKESD